jgi:linoleoyl-CoA desaturase
LQFTTDLRRKVALYLDITRDRRFGNTATWLKAGNPLVIAFALFVATVCACGTVGLVVKYIGMFLAAVLLSVNVMHDASHGALYKFGPPNAIVTRAFHC